MKGELYFLINPASSSGNGMKVWKKISRILNERHIIYKSVMLNAPGEAEKAVTHIISGTPACTIVIVGGDGSINEVFGALRTIEDLSGVCLGCIPTGSGNDFIRGLGLPFEPEKALDVILAGNRVRPVNIGIAAGGKKKLAFAVSSGIGYDAAVCHEVAKAKMKTMLNRIGLGSLIYTFEALKLILSMKPVRMRIELTLPDDETQVLSFDRVWFTAAMNTAYEGGGYRFCPEADPGDGLLDLIVAEGLGRGQVLITMPGAMSGKHVGKKGIHLYRAKAVRVRCDRPSCVHTDGEPVYITTSISWKVKTGTIDACC